MKKALLAVSAVLAVLLCSCSRNSSDYLEAVPGDAVAVVRINPAGLQKNGIDLSSLVDELNSAWNVDHDSGLPYKGIDLQSDMYGFVAPEGRSDYFIGLVFGLSDPKAFASSCSKAGRVKHDGNIDYIVDSDDVVIAWNRNSGIVAASIDGQDPDSMADLAIDLLSGVQGIVVNDKLYTTLENGVLNIACGSTFSPCRLDALLSGAGIWLFGLTEGEKAFVKSKLPWPKK